MNPLSFDHADILLRAEQVSGCFIDPRCDIPAASVNYCGQLFCMHFVRREQLKEYPYVPNGLHELSPDFLVTIRNQANHELVAALSIWTVLDYGLSEVCDAMLLDSLQDSLKHRCDSLVKGLVLRPLVGEEKDAVMLRKDPATLVALPVQLQSSVETITHLLETILGIGPPIHV